MDRNYSIKNNYFLSFLTHCIELYAEHAVLPGHEVYRLFTKTGLLAMHISDYEDLHGMSFEYLMRFFDEYLYPPMEAAEKLHPMSNTLFKPSTLAKAAITPEIIRQIAKKYRVDEMKALDLWYNSPIAKCLADDETGLWGQSPLYIFSLFEEDSLERARGA